MLNQGSSALFSSIQQTYASKLEVIKASKLTKILHMLIKKNPPPLTHQKRIKLKFAHPSGKNPIKIVIYGNQTQKIPGYYTNYLSNNFIKELNLIGSTIKIIFKNSVNPYI
ncbi:hypothetical protein HIC20_00725 [Buchnera aphidicola (Hormaphis cornu)]|nr:hypothetical protein HIC20_00725 [Buchnera aphidicola (Hormaphis cornu)]